jgi:xanthine dehydrogenase YagR molybdenum-binding subunit
VEKIKFELGDSRLPPAIGQFGSLTTTSVGSAVNDACVALRQKAVEYLKKSQSSLQNTPVEDFVFGDGKIKTKDDAVSISYADLLQQQHLPSIEVTVDSKGSEEANKYSSYSYNATFVEVGVHALTNQLKVNRVVSAIDAGKIMNKKTALSQVYGSVTWGIGMALTEESVIDDRYGRWMVKDLADYHVPVNADIPAIEVLFIDKSDDILTPIGAKGLGEIGIVGVAAAIANAVYHATGKRVRDLPITPDKLV